MDFDDTPEEAAFRDRGSELAPGERQGEATRPALGVPLLLRLRRRLRLRGKDLAASPVRRRLGGYRLAARVRWPGRRCHSVDDLPPGGGALRRDHRAVRRRHRDGRSDDHQPRHRPAAGSVASGHVAGRGDLVPAVQRTRRRIRPRRPRHPRRTRRGRVGRERPEGVEFGCAPRRHGDPPGPHRRHDVPKHRGITFFVLDMHTPGIDVRPLRQMTGGATFNEVFLTDVRVPVANVVGDVNGGWRATMTTLANERSLSGGTSNFAQVLKLARASGVAHDPLIRQRLARCYVQGQIVRYLGFRAQTAVSRGLSTPESTILKLCNSQMATDMAELTVAVQGPRGSADRRRRPGARLLAAAVPELALAPDRRRQRRDPAQCHRRAGPGSAAGPASRQGPGLPGPAWLRPTKPEEDATWNSIWRTCSRASPPGSRGATPWPGVTPG